MLRIGLTGGIGAGKSTVSAAFSEQGAVVVDGDVISREVVEPGTEGLAALVDAFGEEILLPDGALNRPALAAVAFSDDEKRATLNGIVHPLVGARRAELIAAASEDAVVVEDIPLLVESQMASMFPLVVIVNADEEVRVARLVEYRGFSEADARARIAAQATEEQRRAVADVWLDNSGSSDDLERRALELWNDRILPFAQNVRDGRAAQCPRQLVAYRGEWAEEAQRIVNRLQTACGSKVLRIDHVGSTAVPGLEAKDVIDVQVTVASLDVADELAAALADVGYPRIENATTDTPHTGDPALWHKRLHGGADPGRPANVHLRVEGWPGQQFALLFRDWLRANPEVRSEYVAVKREAEKAPNYAQAKEPWLVDAYGRAWKWADATGWRP
jgi:dephospho-CoA kinase